MLFALFAGASAALAQPARLPESISGVASNTADDFVKRVMGRFTIGDVPIGAASIKSVQSVVERWEVEVEDGVRAYAVTTNVKWKTVLTGGTGFNAQLLIRVNPKDMTWLVIPKSIDDNARLFWDTGIFLKDALLNMTSDVPVWNNPDRALQMFRGQAPKPEPSAPQPPAPAGKEQHLDGPRLYEDTGEKAYPKLDQLIRVTFLRTDQKTVPLKDGLPSWSTLTSAVDAAKKGNLHAVGDEEYHLKMDPGTACVVKWSCGQKYGFAVIARKPDGTYFLTRNGDDTKWRRLQTDKHEDIWWNITEKVPFTFDTLLKGDGTLLYRVRFKKCD